MRRLIGSLFVLLASGCCGQSGPCPQNDVMILVHAEQGSVPATVIGYEFECTPADSLTLCRTAAIADGDYRLIVQPDGHPAVEIELMVRTNVAPAFSCECEIPTGRADVHLDSAPVPPDAAMRIPDAGTPAFDDAGAS